MSARDNVRVCCRFRPLNKAEKAKNCRSVVDFVGTQQVICKNPKGPEKKFVLDHFFPPDSTQEKVYEYTAQPLVEEVMKGYHATMFAYGQTGSGKTHTMEGELEDEKLHGMTPRMIHAIFDQISEADENLEWNIKVSYIEIYLENIRDLLSRQAQRRGGGGLQIRESQARGVFIQGVEEAHVASPDDVFDLMHQGAAARQVASTNMNAVSSRSHAVFMIQLQATHRGTQSTKISKLMSVDLAGSEKTRKTQAEGQRLDEAKMINGSLSCLGNVINALTSKNNRHIPYRNSKLTRLLSDSLGGNSKTCIIVTASPSDFNVEETISTLRFGVNCKKVKNNAKMNVELSKAEYQAKIKKLEEKQTRHKKQIHILRQQVIALSDALRDAGGDPEAVLEQVDADIADEEEEEERKNAEDDRGGSPRARSGSPAARRGRNVDDEDVGDRRSASRHRSASRGSNRGADRAPAGSPGAGGGGRRSRSRARQNKRDRYSGLIGSSDTDALQQRIDELLDELEKETKKKEDYMDDLVDVRTELEASKNRVKEIEESVNSYKKGRQEAEDSVKKMSGQMGEFKLYKTKLEFQKKEHSIETEKLKGDIELMRRKLQKAKDEARELRMQGGGSGGQEVYMPLEPEQENTLREFEPDAMEPPPDKTMDPTGELTEQWKKEVDGKYKEVYKRLLEEMQKGRELRQRVFLAESAGAGGGGGGDRGGDDRSSRQRKEHLIKHVKEKAAIQRKYDDLRRDYETVKRRLKNTEQREKYNDALRAQWQNQLSQMEQAVLMANQIHNRDRQNFARELEARDSELTRLRKFLKTQINQKGKRSNIVKPVQSGRPAPPRSSRSGRRTRQKRPSQAFGGDESPRGGSPHNGYRDDRRRRDNHRTPGGPGSPPRSRSGRDRSPHDSYRTPGGGGGSSIYSTPY